MAYVPTVWENDITEVDEDNMNHIEQGIKDNDDKLQGLTSMGNIVVDSVRSKNMFNVLTCISGGINNSTGQPEKFDMVTITNKNANNGSITFSTSYNWKGIISEYIEVEENKAYTISFTTTENTMIYIAWFYDDNKNYLSNHTFTPGISITTPSNTKYVRVLLETSNATSLPATITLSNIQFEKGSSATPYSPFQDLNNQEVYSSSEVKIGTWIDGKPIYRKVITATTNASNYEALVSNVATLFNSYGFIYYDGTNARPINMMGINQSSSYFRVDFSGSNNRIYSNFTSDLRNKNYILVLEYTKTTD